MDLMDFRAFCLSLPEVEEAMPFDDRVLIFKVGGKLFTCCDILNFREIAVKSDPDVAVELRERYADITPARYFNKRHWNAIRLEGDLPEELIRLQILNSYRIVVYKSVMPKAERLRLIEVYEKWANEHPHGVMRDADL